ncbi:MAG TPA: hypothetical protein VKZ60_02505 [Chloroflexota bacterium]|nr:hypothetical protein [Chloroflexota bacterium]
MGLALAAALGRDPRPARVATWPLAPSLDTVWLVLCAAYPFVVLNWDTLAADDGDLWWTLALGRAVWETGALPAHDPLAYTPTDTPFRYAQWLAGLLLYGAYRLGGGELLLVLRAALVATVFALLYRGCRRAGAAPPLAGLGTLLVLPLVNVGLALRPQLFALVPFVLYLEATRHPVAGGRWRWLLPLVMVFWVNVHGSFLLGIALVALALLARAGALAWREGWRGALGEPGVRALAQLLALSLLAPLANPYGLDLVPYLQTYLAANPDHVGLGDLLTEWVPTSLATPGGPAFFASLAVLAAALYASRQRLGTAELLRLGLFAGLGLRWLRGIVWWGLVLPAPLAGVVQRGWVGPPAPAAPRGHAGLNALLLGAALVAGAASLPWWRAYYGPLAPPLLAPSPLVTAADWLATQEPEPVFHYLAWGPYLAWRLERPVFADGRYEAHPRAVFADYLAVSEARPGWETRLTAYGVEWLVLDQRAQAPLVRAAAASPAWQRAWETGPLVVFRRAPGATR